MLGSRGFDFEKQFSPHGGKNMKCKCEFVAGYKGETKIEGYDTKSLYEQWQLSRSIRADLKLSQEEIKEVFRLLDVQSIDSIDAESFVFEWIEAKNAIGSEATLETIAVELSKNKPTWSKQIGMYSNEQPIAKVQAEEYESKIKKSIEKAVNKFRSSKDWSATVGAYLDSIAYPPGSISSDVKAEIWPHEIEIAQNLSKNGMDVSFIKASNTPGSHTPDALVDGVPFEFKRVRSGSLKKVFSNTWEALSQSPNVVIDLTASDIPFEQGAAEAKKHFNEATFRYQSKYEKKIGAPIGDKKVRMKRLIVIKGNRVEEVFDK